MENKLFEKKIETEVAVAGAGLAGISAAISAARAGRKVVLITDRPVLGGSASSEIRVGPGGADHSPFNRYGRETGIIEEVFNELFYRAANSGKWRWFYFDQIYFDMVFREENISLLLNTSVISAQVEDSKIKSIQAMQLRSETLYTVTAKIFIDCTGDGTLGYLAGNDYMFGREGKSEYNEVFAPPIADKKTMGATLLFTSVDARKKTQFKAPPWAIDITSLPSFPRISNSIQSMPDGSYYGFWWVEYGGELDSIHDDQEIILHLRRLVMGIWDYIKNSGNFPDAENQELNWIGYLPGKRESRRLKGVYIMNANDIRSQRHFEDAIGYTGWPIDVHPPEGYLNKDYGCTHEFIKGITDIPLSILISDRLDNLAFAGRHISCTHEALGSLRLISTTSVMGQAVGETASICIEKGKNFKQIRERHIEELKQRLARKDQSIIGYRLNDPDDLALKAEVSATSKDSFQCTEEDGYIFAEKTTGLILTGVERLDTISLMLSAENETTAILDLYECGDELENYRVNKLEKSVEVKVKEKGWYEFAANIATRGKKLFAMVRKNPDLKLYLSSKKLTGALSILSRDEIMDYDTHYSVINIDGEKLMLFNIAPEYADYYDIKNLKNGYIRPYGGANLWRSGSLKDNPQQIHFRFETPVTFNSMHFVFNSNLNHKRIGPRINKVEDTIVKGFKVSCIRDGKEQTIFEETQNYKRFVDIDFESVTAGNLTVTINETWGLDNAEVFDIRIYNKQR